jgi:uncharacterized protein YraI
MLTKYRSVRMVLSLVAIIAASAAAGSAQAQPAATDGPYWAVVTQDNVQIRSGSSDRYYPFMTVKRGELVKVVGRKYQWLRIATEGPVFKDLYGYIRQPKSTDVKKQVERFRMLGDGVTGRTLGRVHIVAPNLLMESAPSASWKELIELPPDTEARVLEVIESETETAYKVKAPATGTGWINGTFVTPATPEQVRAFLNPGEAAPVEPEVADAGAEEAAAEDGQVGEEVLAREEPVVEPVEEQPAVEQPAVEETTEEPAVEPGQPEANTPTEIAAPAEVEDSNQKRLEDLEAAFTTLRTEPIETAEVLPLRDLYLDLARKSADNHAISRFAEARAEQLKIWSELQARRIELAAVRKRLKMDTEEAEAVRLALETTGDYIAVGRLVASTIFDGQRLPRLYRLQDPATGRTIAYLRPGEGFNLTGMLDQMIGVMGRKSYDGSVRLNIITPRRIDLLAPQS